MNWHVFSFLIYITTAICLLLPLDAAEEAPSRFRVAEGFIVDSVFETNPDTHGSWVALASVPGGDLYASDQEGSIWQLTLSEDGPAQATEVDLNIGHVHGLTWAFDSLYAVVGDRGAEKPGLYRLLDHDGDGRLDEVTMLREFVGKGEHGPHSVIPGPKGRWLYVVAGNHAEIPRGDGFRSLVPEHWGEDDLLPRLWGPIGSEAGTPAPGGWIARTDPKGKSWELVSMGLRNAFDIAFDGRGELFTYDADAEFDMGTPWYQPTRLLHVIPGTDYGWRSGSGKWRSWYPDTVAPLIEFGPGSPAGIVFGEDTLFPDEYRNALFACDWSWGRIFAVHLKPQGAGFVAEHEEFLTGVPLPVADIVSNPQDKCLYFVLGGRGTESGVYRIRWNGTSHRSDAPPSSNPDEQAISARRELEAVVATATDEEIPIAWNHLGSDDPILRQQARIVLEHVPSSAWRVRALNETDPRGRREALLALARAGDSTVFPVLLASLAEIDESNRADAKSALDSLRVIELALIRMASNPEEKAAHANSLAALKKALLSDFPSSDHRITGKLLELLVFLEAPEMAERGIGLLDEPLPQARKLGILANLANQSQGWTPELRKRYFTELGQAHGWHGGLSFAKYLETIATAALDTVTESEREKWASVFQAAIPEAKSVDLEPARFVQAWTLNDLLPIDEGEWENRDLESGRNAYLSASCFACHQFRGEGGGIGPDLTAAAKRFSSRDLLEAIIDPGKVISDQYGLSEVRKTDGSTVVGKVVNYSGRAITLQTDLLNPLALERVPRKHIESIEASKVSSMPPGLLNGLTRDQILDLLAYLRDSR